LADEDGMPAPLEVSEHNCPECGKNLIRRFKKGRGGYDFWGCSGFRDGCKTSFPNQNGVPDFSGARRA
jgi:DNA topoisomerase-1